ncbi:ubiquitin thioesterase otulin [Microcaecilia unicolor]|uniref:Ubiquitin thioesterase otulin-like n=1 Tax=Microcaecilia unicolor TaxID=1415580 RepID=A0A6P7YRI3_9AMPH|nr:ubiquitin thioesterase otulin-like [Microcaecilia unicolor]
MGISCCRIDPSMNSSEHKKLLTQGTMTSYSSHQEVAQPQACRSTGVKKEEPKGNSWEEELRTGRPESFCTKEITEKHSVQDERLFARVQEQATSFDIPCPLQPEFLTCSTELNPRGISAAAEKPNVDCEGEACTCKSYFSTGGVTMSGSATNGILGMEVESECSDVSPDVERTGLKKMQETRSCCAHNDNLSQLKKYKHKTAAKGQRESCLRMRHEAVGPLGDTEQASQGTAQPLSVWRDVLTVGAEHCHKHAAARISESGTISEGEASVTCQGGTTYMEEVKYSSPVTNWKERPSNGSNIAAVESPVDNEDIYRDAEEIEKENRAKGSPPFEDDSSGENKLSVTPEIDIVEYCKKEWRGNTEVSKRMKKGYEAVSQSFSSIRRVRGDNYCALRATLFQALSQATDLPAWLRSAGFTQLPTELIKKYKWLKQWKLQQQLNSDKNENLCGRITEYLELLKTKWAALSEIKSLKDKQAACDETFRNEDEYSLYEALKFLMLSKAVELFNDYEEGKEVPVFSWLLFARNTSSTPYEFMKNHLNHVGHTGGLEQVEMFLLGYALQHTIKVYRLYKFETDEFITLYPNDQEDWPVVTLITEDDRHYNVPVRECEETSV